MPPESPSEAGEGGGEGRSGQAAHTAEQPLVIAVLLARAATRARLRRVSYSPPRPTDVNSSRYPPADITRACWRRGGGMEWDDCNRVAIT